MSDIGRFSLPELFFEGTRQSRDRGLYEQSMAIWAMLMKIKGLFCAKKNNRAQFSRSEKVEEGMA